MQTLRPPHTTAGARNKFKTRLLWYKINVFTMWRGGAFIEHRYGRPHPTTKCDRQNSLSTARAVRCETHTIRKFTFSCTTYQKLGALRARASGHRSLPLFTRCLYSPASILNTHTRRGEAEDNLLNQKLKAKPTVSRLLLKANSIFACCFSCFESPFIWNCPCTRAVILSSLRCFCLRLCRLMPNQHSVCPVAKECISSLYMANAKFGQKKIACDAQRWKWNRQIRVFYCYSSAAVK